MSQNYGSSVYNATMINHSSLYLQLVLEIYYGEFIKTLDKEKYILEFGPGQLNWFQFLYSKGFRKFILIEIDKSFYDAQEDFLKQYEDIDLIHINSNITNEYLFEKFSLENVTLISSFQVIEHIKYGDLNRLMQSFVSLHYKGFFLFETINAQNIIQANFAIYHDITHVNSFTPRSFKMILAESGGNFQYLGTRGVGYPTLFNPNSLSRLFKSRDKDLFINLGVNTFHALSYSLSKLISRYFIGRYISKDEKIFDSGVAFFFKIQD